MHLRVMIWDSIARGLQKAVPFWEHLPAEPDIERDRYVHIPLHDAHLEIPFRCLEVR